LHPSHERINFRQRIAGFLQAGDLNQLRAGLRRYPPGKLLKPLFSAICSAEEKVRWRAISAMGETVSRLADQDMEAARVVMRRLMWSLNDESGGIGWGSPEAMAEIMAGHAGLAEEYTHILVAYMREEGFFLEYEPLQRGLLWGLARLARSRPELLRSRDAALYLRPYLKAADAQIRGFAALALGYLQDGASLSAIEKLQGDPGPVRFYEDGEIRVTCVGELARRALADVDAAGSQPADGAGQA
jgi:hypothetical protein